MEARKIEQQPTPKQREQAEQEQALRELVDEIRADAQVEARRYLEETLVPGGGE